MTATTAMTAVASTVAVMMAAGDSDGCSLATKTMAATVMAVGGKCNNQLKREQQKRQWQRKRQQLQE
jgi:hypothetical protein